MGDRIAQDLVAWLFYLLQAHTHRRVFHQKLQNMLSFKFYRRRTKCKLENFSESMEKLKTFNYFLNFPTKSTYGVSALSEQRVEKLK